MLLRKAYYLKKSFDLRGASPDRLRRFQDRLLQQRVADAYADSTFYRDNWDANGVDPDGIGSVDDLQDLPVAGFDDTARQDGPFSTGPSTDRPELKSSGTSSGDRTVVEFDRQAWDWLEATYLRGFLAQGYRPRGRQSYYWYDAFDRGLLTSLAVPKDRVPTDLSFQEQLDLLEEQDGRYLVYFPVVLFTLAKIMLDSDREWDIDPDIVFTQGENLTPAMRGTITEAFEAPVFDNYGASEFNRIATECPAGNGYHIHADTVRVEVLGRDGDPVDVGESGVLVGTGLVNQATPLIRYNLGDIVIRGGTGRCDCGSTFPRLRAVRGRAENVVATADGPVHPDDIVDVLARHRDLRTFRFVAGDEHVVNYVPGPGFDDGVLDDVQKAFQDDLGLDVVFEEVDRVPETPGGKLPPVTRADGTGYYRLD